MGLPEEEIGQLTIAQYEALSDRRRVADNKARLNAGIVAAAIINTWRAEGSPAISPLVFVPDWNKKEEMDLTKLSPEEQKNFFMNLFMGGGKSSMR